MPTRQLACNGCLALAIAEQLRLLPRFDDAQLWKADGCRDCILWLDRHLVLPLCERELVAAVLELFVSETAEFCLRWRFARQDERQDTSAGDGRITIVLPLDLFAEVAKVFECLEDQLREQERVPDEPDESNDPDSPVGPRSGHQFRADSLSRISRKAIAYEWPRPMVRAVISRDRCCQMPGCTRTRFGQEHYVIPVVSGGRTEIRNACMLCSTCHRALHEHGTVLAGPRCWTDPFSTKKKPAMRNVSSD